MQVIPLITNPITLVALVLALVFLLLGKHWSRNRKKDRTLFVLFAALAVVVVAGGLALAWRQIQPPPGSPRQDQTATQVPPKPDATPAREIKQESKGDQSPNIANTGGSVSITHGSQSSPKPVQPDEPKK